MKMMVMVLMPTKVRPELTKSLLEAMHRMLLAIAMMLSTMHLMENPMLIGT